MTVDLDARAGQGRPGTNNDLNDNRKEPADAGKS